MRAQLDRLLDLQNKDLALLDADTRLKAILDQTDRLDEAIASAREEIATARRLLGEGTQRREELELRIESYRAIQERRRQRIESARGAREIQAMMVEVEIARSVLAREESEWLKVAEASNELERGLQAAEERLVKLEEEQATERVRLEAERERLEGERTTAQSAREASASSLERTLRVRYDRLRSSRVSVAVVVPLRGEACGACFTAVPRNRRSQIRAGVLLANCEACGVILYASDTE